MVIFLIFRYVCNIISLWCLRVPAQASRALQIDFDLPEHTEQSLADVAVARMFEDCPRPIADFDAAYSILLDPLRSQILYGSRTVPPTRICSHIGGASTRKKIFVVASSINGCNGEATNTDDVNNANSSNKRLHKEANTNKYRRNGNSTGKHQKVENGPPQETVCDAAAIAAKDDASRVTTDEAKENHVKEAIITQPVKNADNRRPDYVPRHVQKQIYYQMPTVHWWEYSHMSEFLNGTVILTVLKWYHFISSDTFLVLLIVWYVLLILGLCGFWNIDRMGTFHSLKAIAFFTPADIVVYTWFGRHRVGDRHVEHHTDRSFNAFVDKTICMTFYDVLHVKHPAAAPSDHAIQQFAATLNNHFGPDVSCAQREILYDTCKFYYQDMLRADHERRLLGIRRAFPTA